MAREQFVEELSVLAIADVSTGARMVRVSFSATLVGSTSPFFDKLEKLIATVMVPI